MLIHICSIEFTAANYNPKLEQPFDGAPFIVTPADGVEDSAELRKYIDAALDYQLINPYKYPHYNHAVWESHRTTWVLKPGAAVDIFQNYQMHLRNKEDITWPNEYKRFNVLLPDVDLLTVDSNVTVAATQAYFDAMYLKDLGGNYDGRFSNEPPARTDVINTLMAFKTQGTIEHLTGETIDWLEKHNYAVQIVLGRSKPFALTVLGDRLLEAFLKLETGQ